VLLKQLNNAGVHKRAGNEILTETDKQRLLHYLQASHEASLAERKKITLIKNSTAEIRQADATGRLRTIQIKMRKKGAFINKNDEPALAVGSASEEAAARCDAEYLKAIARTAAEQAEPHRKKQVEHAVKLPSANTQTKTEVKAKIDEKNEVKVESAKNLEEFRYKAPTEVKTNRVKMTARKKFLASNKSKIASLSISNTTILSKTVSVSTDFPRFVALSENLQYFSKKIQLDSNLTDGLLTARVVGEFSAGKTRLLSELFGHQIPESLMPISSLEPQTRLQLEITYGDAPALSLVEREQDYQPAHVVRQLSEFPDRQKLSDLDPMRYRLRLAVNEPRLILHEGDGYNEDKSPKRLFLIDTPGWSSGDDELAEQEASALMTGYHNLALVYVSQAGRLDGVVNADHLRDFMSALADADFLDMDRAKLLLVITRCPGADASRIEKRARDLVHRLWNELGRDDDELSLDVFCVDFHAMSIEALQQFREGFWRSLLEPLKQPAQPVGHPWVATLRRWPEAWDLRPGLRASAQVLERAKTLLLKARQDDEFVAGMNMYRLTGLDGDAIRKKVSTAWARQLGGDPVDLAAWSLPELPSDHPLSDWWSNYWLPQLSQALAPVEGFLGTARQAINRLTPDIEDLKDYFLSELDRPHFQALSALEGSFSCLVDTAQDLIDEPAAEKRLATLFTLSLLQARYEDYYAQHAASATR